jgi:integrase
VGTVYRPITTRQLPQGAEIFTRQGNPFARWRDRRGKVRTASIIQGKDGSQRISIESPYFIAKYRDGSGTAVKKSTGCRHEDAARRVLADLEREAELIRSGVKTAAESAAGQYQAMPLTEHFAAYIAHLEAKGCTQTHRQTRESQLRRLALDCGFSTLADLRHDALERWLVTREREGMGARTRNAYRIALVAFCNWCADPNIHRLTTNPFRAIPQANEKADPRRQRRAMTENELTQLLSVARERPLLDTLTVRRGKRRGERYANVRPEVRERLELLGRERALIYKTLVLTGLRKGELASLTVGQLHLDGLTPSAVLDAADEKNREGNTIALRADLAADLREWLADKLDRIQSEARRLGRPIPAKLPPDTPLFIVPAGLLRILNRDLRMAGIAKRDDRDRVLDVHALRHTFGTLLSKGGVAPRTAQAAMRHSKIDLTMNVYTDPRLLDVVGALDALPSLPLSAPAEGKESVRATGTDNFLPERDSNLVVPTVVPTFDKPCTTLTIADKPGSKADFPVVAASPYSVNKKEPLSIADSGSPKSGVQDSNLRPLAPKASALAKLS